MALETMKEYYTRMYAETKGDAYLALLKMISARQL